MKKNIVKTILGILILLILLSSCLIWGTVLETSKERELAKKLQVDLSENKEFTGDFPSHYFYLTLAIGMPIEEVHQRVIHYEKVLKCANRSEIYYYYTDDDDTARRFEIIYDAEGRLKEFRGEESDSPTIQTTGCVEGLIEP